MEIENLSMPSLLLLILFMHASIPVLHSFWLAWKYSVDSEYICLILSWGMEQINGADGVWVLGPMEVAAVQHLITHRFPKAGTPSVLGVSRKSSGKVGGVGADPSPCEWRS